VGWLRVGNAYRAPAKWYGGGPTSQIEYYFADPAAEWIPYPQRFFPLGFFRGETNTGVGELTGKSVRRFWNGVWAEKPPGTAHVGTASDFGGLSAYPGPTDADHLPNCSTPPPAPLTLGCCDGLPRTLFTNFDWRDGSGTIWQSFTDIELTWDDVTAEWVGPFTVVDPITSDVRTYRVFLTLGPGFSEGDGGNCWTWGYYRDFGESAPLRDEVLNVPCGNPYGPDTGVDPPEGIHSNCTPVYVGDWRHSAPGISLAGRSLEGTSGIPFSSLFVRFLVVE